MTSTEAGSGSGPAFGMRGPLRPDTAVWIIRHGETEWSLSGRHTGSTDVPLTRAGESQAAALRTVLAGVDPALVLCSPRVRALETARLAGLVVDDVSADLSEWDYGDYEGITTEEIREDVPDWTVWHYGCPNGESVADVQLRADRVLNRVLDEGVLDDGAEPGALRPVVLVGHGHFSRVLGARWIGLPASGGAHLLLGTAAPSVLGAEHGIPALRQWNRPNPDTC